MKKGEILENIKVEKLVFGGKGFTRLDDGKVAFITGGAIPGSIVNLKIIKKRKDYYETQITQVIKKSSIETGNYELFPGAPWMNIDYNEQLKIKQSQIEESFFHVKKLQPEIDFLPIIAAPEQFGYRNKIEFSFGKYISHKEERNEQFNVGFHARGEFSRVEDYQSCALIDDEQNKIYTEVRKYTKNSGLPSYDQKFTTGFWRHFMMRRMHFSGQILLVFSINPSFFSTDSERSKVVDNLKNFIQEDLLSQFPAIMSVYISYNTNKADTLIGEMELVYGNPSIEEKLLGYSFDIGPKSFFQTNSQGAEILYTTVKDFFLSYQKDTKMTTILDLYAGTGTIGMVFSDTADRVVSVEIVAEASKNGKENARKNGVKNMEFVNEKVENFLTTYLEQGNTADLLIIDPPRAGMHPDTLPNILRFATKQMIYVSCNPATLARDLQYILENSDYKIEKVQAVDMFPHTHHIETVVSLIKKEAA